MEDTSSRTSIDSAAEEFVVVGSEPKVVHDGSSIDLEKKMDEVLADDSKIEAVEKDADKTPSEECTVFNQVTYLGSTTVSSPRSESEINRNMAILNEQSQMAIGVVLSVPRTSAGVVRLLEPDSRHEISCYRINQILFCARGVISSSERACFAFTCIHGDLPSDGQIFYQCHIFRSDIPEAVGKILVTFADAFRCIPQSSVCSADHASQAVFTFNVQLEFLEEDSRGNFNTCPRDKSAFKLRCSLEKKINVSVTQTSNRELKIDRCFGMLLAPGRKVKPSDMQLIELVDHSEEGHTYSVLGYWDPNDPAFQVLNTETPKDTRVFMNIAVDLVISGIHEPVRFLIESKAQIYPASERFWYFSKRTQQEQFVLRLKQSSELSPDGQVLYDFVSLENQSSLGRKGHGFSFSLISSRSLLAQNADEECESDGEEPLISGSGSVSKEVTDENLLESWHEVLVKWHGNLRQRPKGIASLIRKGIPEALRGEVWQLMVGCTDNKDMYEAYRILIAKDSPSEQTILRDINRTFPAHEFFRETGGIGQDSLYKIGKAYSIYDQEVGYCQGLSFLAASLLLHMPEEQAFCVMVKVMFDYKLRDLFKQGFEELQLKFYELERLMQDQLSDLYEHFCEMGIEAHMFASQWFLTLFTAKFPLFMVFHILDLVLNEGLTFIFNVALSLLKTSRKELLAQDFEGILKFFRVSMPKKYRAEEASKELMQVALSIKVSQKKLAKYERDYMALQEQQRAEEDPMERLERENKRLLEGNMRLEQENDELAYDLVTSKISLRNELDIAEDKVDALSKDLSTTQTLLADIEDEKGRLDEETTKLKEMCRREMDQSEADSSQKVAIIADYKQICSQLSERLEKIQCASKDEIGHYKSQMAGCKSCSLLLGDETTDLKLTDSSPADVDMRLLKREDQIRELELELAQTKLALVESQCKAQDLTHDLHSAIAEIQTPKNTWFQKTISSLREATEAKNKKPAKDG